MTSTVLPSVLDPTATDVLSLPSGRTVALPKATPRFVRWCGPAPADTYGNKAILDFQGRPAFAELIILWTLEGQGWKGAWIDTYRRGFRSGYWGDAPDVELQPGPAALLNTIYDRAGSRAGAFDVIAWQGDRLLFAESKWSGRDHLRQSQLRWVEAALDAGVLPDHLLVVEWSLVGEGG